MPSVKQIKTDDYHLILWKIDEDLQFFTERIILSLAESQEFTLITKEARKREWMAARYVQRQLVNFPLKKDEFGKPFLEDNQGFISISHCTNYAAAIYSPTLSCGIDIEPIHDKVLRVSDKFLSPKESQLFPETHDLNHTIAAWSIKESVYKCYGKKRLNFKDDMVLTKLSLAHKKATVDFKKEEKSMEMAVHVEKYQDLVLAFTVKSDLN